MQFAHNGANAALDLVRVVCPSVTLSWGKRRVTAEDVLRSIGVLSWTPVKSPTAATSPQSSHNPYFLTDYGRDKICIERRSDSSIALQEHKSNMDFEANLRTLWLAYDGQKANVGSFIASLPLAVIKTCASVAKATPLNVKGRRMLEELKAGFQRRDTESGSSRGTTPSNVTSSEATSTKPTSKLGLLDRTRAKEQELAEAARQGPSAEELERQGALQRAEDVAGVVGMLSMAAGGAGRARISFTMAALLLKLQDSLRAPIPREDSAKCIRLLAAEVAPEWMRVVTVGGRENVVVQPVFEPSQATVQERIKALLA